MKVHLEFEDQDLEEMIVGYFESQGFKVKNLEEIKAQFTQAFPDGLRIEAETIPLPEPQPQPAVRVSTMDLQLGPNPTVQLEPAVGEMLPTGSPALPLGELMDPAVVPPTFDPKKEDHSAALYTLVRYSGALQQELVDEGRELRPLRKH